MVLSFGGAWLLLHYVFERPFAPAILEVVDTDRNGQISLAEFQAAAEKGFGRRMHGPGAGRGR